MKRIFDFIFSLILLITLLPLFFFIILLIFITLGRPIFFIQQRPGLREAPFNLIKFRTLKNLKDKNGIMLADENRISKFGNILRKFSLDELPQLINVIKGDMSLVGPRPLLTEYLKLYNEYQKKRHMVLPGITGWSQINGRNSISWDERLSMDVWYVDNKSFVLDLKIILKTIQLVILQKNVSPKGANFMEKFKK